jgi:hypothetical protein
MIAGPGVRLRRPGDHGDRRRLGFLRSPSSGQPCGFASDERIHGRTGIPLRYRAESSSSGGPIEHDRKMGNRSKVFQAAWIGLALIGVAIIAFGIVTLATHLSGDEALWQADAVASIGTGVFGLLITVFGFRRREQWAWWTLWFYPAFWRAHLIGDLPPGKDHVHQILFIVISLAALLATIPRFFRRPAE